MKRNINLLLCLSAFNVATFLYDSWLGVKGSNLKPYESESSALPIAPTPNIYLAEEGRLELPRHLAMTYRFALTMLITYSLLITSSNK